MESAQPALAAGESLPQFFHELVVKNYSAVGLSDTVLADYVAQVLGGFVAARALYPFHDAGHRPLVSLAALIAASDPVHGDAPSFVQEATVRRHIGDLALFFTGMFPESLGRRRGADALLDFVAAGKRSYRIVSEYERSRATLEPPVALAALAFTVFPERAPRAPLFALLAAEFERCMHGLNLVKSEIESLSDPLHAAVRELLLN